MRRTSCILWIGTGLCARPTFFRTLLGQDRELITWNNQETPAFPEMNSVIYGFGWFGIWNPHSDSTENRIFFLDVLQRYCFHVRDDLGKCFLDCELYSVDYMTIWPGMLDVLMFALQVSPGLSCQSLNSMTSMCCTRCRNSRPTVHNLPYMFAFWVILVSLFRHLDT